MGNRYLDWLRQADADLRHAHHALADGDFEWSCFAAQQAAEKAMKSLSSVVIRSADRPAITRAVESYVARLRAEHPEIERIIWFGSWVNGLPLPGSDVDLCLILHSSDKPLRERIPDYLPVGFPVGMDLFAYTRAEFGRLPKESSAWHAAIMAGREL